MSWIKFKTRYLFSLNFAIAVSVLLFSIRKDFTWHPVVAGWLVLACSSDTIELWQKKFLHFLGQLNSTILLTSFYFLFFTPFSVIYRVFFRNEAFKKSSSRLVEKDKISDFARPF